MVQHFETRDFRVCRGQAFSAALTEHLDCSLGEVVS